MATVTVLAVLALVTVLVVGIFSYATRETAGAKGLADSLHTQWLRDLPVNLVIAQLREAAAEPGAVWASQPGAVRTFGAGGSQTIRKLYSAADMVVGSPAALATDLQGNWRSHPDRFTDLNRPALGADGDLHFPILDPRILGDPAAMPEGFSVARDRVPGGVRGGFAELPMPVAWLYVLRDGTVGPLDASGNFRGPGSPAADNPIVGRIAFWTDDECAKINLNTASEGVAWDFPRDRSEVPLARFQPVGREFQRQPGHPAMVSLSSVFFPGERLDPGAGDDPETAERNALRRRAILAAAPGIRTAATSDAGTRSVGPDEAAAADRPNAMTDGAGRLYPSVDDYLFGNRIGADGVRTPGPLLGPELGLDPGRLGRLRFFLTVHSRAPEVNLSGFPRVALWPVAAVGEAANPAAGPGPDDPPAALSAVDRLMRFCASAGGSEYLFQRAPRSRAGEDAERAGGGRNRALLDMLRGLATRPVPGWGASFAEKYGPAGARAGDLDQILVQMVDYVREANLVDRSAAASAYAGGTGAARPGLPRLEPGHGQVPGLVLDAAAAPAPDPDAPKGIGRIATISEAVLVFICTGEVVKEGDELVVKGGGPVDGQDRLKEHWKQIGGKVEEGERRLLPALLLEGFCPGQGWTHLIPGLTLTISGASGSAIEGGVPDLRIRLRGNQLVRVPFAGRGSNRRSYQDGAQAVTTRTVAAAAQVGDTPPIAGPWLAWGGSMGPRAFGPAAFSWEEFVVPGDGELAFEGTDEPIRVAIFDTPGVTDPRDGNGADATTAALAPADRSQAFDFLFPPFTAPLPTNSTEADSQEAYWRNSFRGSDGLGTDSRLDRAITSPSLPLRLLEPGRDVARALVPRHNDYRLVANRALVAADQFVPHPDYASGGLMLVHGLTEPGVVAGAHPSDVAVPHHAYFPPEGAEAGPEAGTPVTADAPAPWDWPPIDELAGAVPGSAFRPGSARPWLTGDFDDGIGAGPAGPFINRPDDIDTRGMGGEGGDAIPWISGLERMAGSNAGFLAPGRLLPSAVMFGSLPSRSRLGLPWVTLLFRPHQSPHPGQAPPPDHLLLDLFWMPVVEPWAISEPFSTAGKINMNHQIVPFTYVRRATGLHALLKAETIVARPDAPGAGGADPDRNTQRDAPGHPLRRRIDAAETLRQFDDRFVADGTLFRSATEICDLWLVPEGEQLGDRQRDGYPAMAAFWDAHRRTGDNTRERPYAALVPRLTTRSNAFTVHYVVQSIQQVRTTPPGTFDGERDAITGEIRGAAIIERSIDPNDRTIPDFAGGAASPSGLEAHHRYRVVGDRVFAP